MTGRRGIARGHVAKITVFGHHDAMTRLNDHGQPIGPDVTVALPRPRIGKPALDGRFARLLPSDPADADALHAAFVDPAGYTYLPTGPFPDAAAHRAWFARMAAGDDPAFLTIHDAAGPAGHAAFLRIFPETGSAEIGYIHLAPRLRRTAAATEAFFLMMDHALGTLGYRRLEWKCDALNAPSRAAALRLGFTFEGIHRQATHYKGRSRDTAWFSILDGEWPWIRSRFEAWLAPGNFDTFQRQLSPLRIDRG